MKYLTIWVKNNLTHLFSIVGILLTIYFSVFYIPQYSEDIRLKRINSVNQDLINTIQELIYNNHVVAIGNIESLIKGKEIKENIIYPYTVEELLIQVQEDFLSNKFIPLNERKKLLDEIDILRLNIEKEEIPREFVEKAKKQSFIQLIISMIGIVVSALGAYSLAGTAKKMKEDEIDDKISERSNIFEERIKKSIEAEGYVRKILEKKFGAENIKSQIDDNLGVDFVAEASDGRNFGFEVKMTDMDTIPVNSIIKTAARAHILGFPIFLLSNGNLNKQARNKIIEINKDSKYPAVYFSNINDFEKVLETIN